MNRGILYFAKGDTFIGEATLSARQVRRVMPEVSIAIVADREPDAECFDEVILDASAFAKRNKPQAMARTPYDRTIYLDTDTYVQEPIDELFDLLDEFEFAVRRNRDESHIPTDQVNDPNTDVPDAFPEFNSGVIPYRRSPAVTDLLEAWERQCLPNHESDQRALRPALYHSSVAFTALPNRYNCIYRNANVVNKRIKVFHGPLVDRHKDRIELREALRKLNASEACRLYYTYGNTLFVNPSPIALGKPWYRALQLRDLVSDRGLRETASLVLGAVSESLGPR